MQESVYQRIKLFQGYLGISTNALAKVLEMNQVTLNDYLRGNRKIALALVESLLIHYPELSAEWLMRGVGSMLINGASDRAKIDERTNALIEAEHLDDARLQDLIDARIMAILNKKKEA